MADSDDAPLLNNDGINAESDDEIPSRDDHRRRITWRCVNGPRWFLVFLCVAAVGCTISTGGLVGVTISTVERRFKFSSWKTSWIRPISKLASLPTLLVVGYFGSKIRRPVWIAGGLLVLAIGTVLYAMPHFVSPPYRFDVTANETRALCHKVGVDTEQKHCPASEVADNIKYEALFIVSSILMGVGSVPLLVLGPTYIDDSTTHSSAAFDIGELRM